MICLILLLWSNFSCILTHFSFTWNAVASSVDIVKWQYSFYIWKKKTYNRNYINDALNQIVCIVYLSLFFDLGIFTASFDTTFITKIEVGFVCSGSVFICSHVLKQVYFHRIPLKFKHLNKELNYLFRKCSI